MLNPCCWDKGQSLCFVSIGNHSSRKGLTSCKFIAFNVAKAQSPSGDAEGVDMTISNFIKLHILCRTLEIENKTLLAYGCECFRSNRFSMVKDRKSVV